MNGKIQRPFFDPILGHVRCEGLTKIRNEDNGPDRRLTWTRDHFQGQPTSIKRRFKLKTSGQRETLVIIKIARARSVSDDVELLSEDWRKSIDQLNLHHAAKS